MKKEEEDNGFLKGSRTVKNASNSSIYKALRRNENKKERRRGRLMAAESHHVPRPYSSWNYAPRPV